MAVRYIYNTKGDYVAFIMNNYLFSPDCDWLGVIRNGNLVYLKNGQFVGYVLNDDRIARKKNELKRLNILRPQAPARPSRPATPLKRLPMLPLLYPYEDVFKAGLIPYKKNIVTGKVKTFNELLNAKLIAQDGTYLGKISMDKYDSESISNPYNNYGSKYSNTSILNTYGTYGSPFSAQSPFNPYSNTPPRIVQDGAIEGYLTLNKYVNNRIDTNELIKWLGL